MLPEDAEKMKAAAEKLKAEHAAAESNTEIPHIAFGVFKNSKNGEWEVAKISYNPDTGEAKMIESISTGGYRMLANEQFKIQVARTLLI